MRRHKPETAMAGHRAWAGCTGWSACGLILMAERTPSGRAAVKDGALARHPKGSSLIAARPGGTLAARINRLFSCLRADRLSAENRLTSITDATVVPAHDATADPGGCGNSLEAEAGGVTDWQWLIIDVLQSFAAG